jgi:hypothetical protein
MIFPRGTIVGRRVGDTPKDEAEHFIRCPACGGWVDCRDHRPSVRARRADTAPSEGSTAMTGAQSENLGFSGRSAALGGFKTLARPPVIHIWLAFFK